MIPIEKFRALVAGGHSLLRRRNDLRASRRSHLFACTNVAVMCLMIFLSRFALSADPPDVHTIIERSVQANTVDWQQAPEYDCYETDRDDQGTKTYQVMMILGSPYERLVAVNEKPLSADQQQAEQHKLELAIANRQKESSRQRTQRIAKYEKDRKRDHLLMEQLTVAFDFQLQGMQKMGPHEVYLLKATPRPGYRPPNSQAKVLTGMEGRLWIETKSYQWVKVEATVVHPVSIAGFLARVEPGTRFELENVPVNENLWLPKHFTMKASAKVLLMFTHRQQEDETYFNYHKAAPDHVLSSTGN
jgi:hypothetical protein